MSYNPALTIGIVSIIIIVVAGVACLFVALLYKVGWYNDKTENEDSTKELTNLEIYNFLLDVEKMIETEKKYYESYENALDFNALSATEKEETKKDIIEGLDEWDDTMILLDSIYEQLKHKGEKYSQKYYSGKEIEIEEIREQRKINSLQNKILLTKKQIMNLNKEAVYLIKKEDKKMVVKNLREGAVVWYKSALLGITGATLDSKYNDCKVRFIGNIDFELSPATPAMEQELEEEVRKQLMDEE